MIDFNPIYILTIVLLAVVIAHICAAPAARMSSAYREWLLKYQLHDICRDSEGILLTAVFPSREKYHEAIDYVLVCHRGIFLINCHNWEGTIFGDVRAPSLTLRQGKHRLKFDNPTFSWHQEVRELYQHLPLPPDVCFVASVFLHAESEVLGSGPLFFDIEDVAHFIELQAPIFTQADIHIAVEHLVRHYNAEEIVLSYPQQLRS